MNRFILRVRAADKNNFLEIKNGLKLVETRAASPQYREIKKGDTLVVVCGRQRVEKKVKRVRIFRSIGAMVKAIPYKKIMPSINSLKDLRRAYYSYPDYREKLRRYGIIAFDI